MFKKYFALSLIILVINCAKQKTVETYIPPKSSGKSGSELAKMYCSSCHQFPEPSLLPKNVWKNGVLPNMALRLGMEADLFKLFSKYSKEELKVILSSNIYPENPQIHKDDWQKITKYYVENAPDNPIKQIAKEKITTGLANFDIKKIYGIAGRVPAVTCVKFKPSTRETYISWRANNCFVKKYDFHFSIIDSLPVNSPVSDIVFKNNEIDILSLGLMDPNDLAKGDLIKFDSKKKSKTVLEKLSRPVQMSYGDLNQDGQEDILVCNFGNEIGNLTWYEGGNKKPHLLKLMPGARQTYITDMNGDKIPDIVVLMTQAKEGILVYYNKGNGVFDERQVLEFSSVYGSSYIDLVDFNNDGFVDILYSNGDNADLSVSLKAFHGIRIFLNDGKNNFKMSYFYPMYGAAKAIAKDFDLDGDLDIAAISFFTDPKQSPHEGFLMFNNQGNNQFKVSTFKEANFGKWMVMDVADMDNDGDFDIILGSFLRNGYLDLEELKFKGENPPSAIVLENKKIK
jgi:FG-GAP-like repeat